MEYDASLDTYVIDFEGGSRVALPETLSRFFFFHHRTGCAFGVASDGFGQSVLGGASADDLKHVRLTRVDESMPMGGWLRAHGLPCQGLYVDSGFEAGRVRSEGGGQQGTTMQSFPPTLPRGRRGALCCSVMAAKNQLTTLNTTTWCIWRMTLS